MEAKKYLGIVRSGCLRISRKKIWRLLDKKNAPVAADKIRPAVEWETFLTGISRGKTVLEYGANDTIFMQGAPADSVFFLLRGKVKLAVASFEGKEAIVGTLGSGEFFGEGCLAGQPLRMATAISVGDCTLARVEKPIMARMLHEKQGLAEMLVTHLLSRNIRYEADLVDQIVQLQREAPGSDSPAAVPFQQGEQDRNGSSRDQSGTLGANGRHNPVADQFFHEQVQEAWLYRLQQPRNDGPQWSPQRNPERLLSLALYRGPCGVPRSGPSSRQPRSAPC